jgi:DNA-binding CsgD family transcriptional regulator
MVHPQSSDRHELSATVWPSRHWTLSALFVLPLIVAAMAFNWTDGARPLHVVLEAGAMMALGMIALLAVRRGELAVGRFRGQLADLRATVARSHDEAERSRQEARRWRAEAQQALRGLAEAIDRQFERWDLTPAEREVGFLLLKGLSLKEIAKLRATSERTARDQARAVYRKAGVSGRSELSAFFLEDLLVLPPHGSPGGSRDGSLGGSRDGSLGGSRDGSLGGSRDGSLGGSPGDSPGDS